MSNWNVDKTTRTEFTDMDSGWSVRFETWSYAGEKVGVRVFGPTGKIVFYDADTRFSVDENGAEQALELAMQLAESISMMDEDGEEQW